MFSWEFYLQAGGAAQILIAATNIPAAKMFRYRENLQRVSPFVREVFIVHNVFIVMTVLAMAALCLTLPGELTNGSLLSRSLCGFLAVFWGLRLVIQLFVYDTELRRKYRLVDVLFAMIFAYLTAVCGGIAFSS